MSTTEIPDTVRSIVQRFNERGRVFPKRHAQHDDDPVKVQESADYDDLKRWRQDDSRFGGHVTSYLDEEMPGWRGQKYYLYLPKAKHIVEYYKREQNFALPVLRGDWESSKHSFEEYRSLSESKAFISQVSQGGCPPSLLSYLNREAPNWLSIGQCKAHARLDESFVKAEGIVDRYISRGRKLPKEWRNHKHDPMREQEYKDAQKLFKWKESVKRMTEGRSGKGGHCCPIELQVYLDTHLPEWRAEARERNIPPMQRAMGIVARYRERGNVIPRQLMNRSADADRLQEFKDAVRLKDWKRALRTGKGGGGGKCDEEVRKYLDANMPEWRHRVYAKKDVGAVCGDDWGSDAGHGSASGGAGAGAGGGGGFNGGVGDSCVESSDEGNNLVDSEERSSAFEDINRGSSSTTSSTSISSTSGTTTTNSINRDATDNNNGRLITVTRSSRGGSSTSLAGSSHNKRSHGGDVEYTTGTSASLKKSRYDAAEQGAAGSAPLGERIVTVVLQRSTFVPTHLLPPSYSHSHSHSHSQEFSQALPPHKLLQLSSSLSSSSPPPPLAPWGYPAPSSSSLSASSSPESSRAPPSASGQGDISGAAHTNSTHDDKEFSAAAGLVAAAQSARVL